MTVVNYRLLFTHQEKDIDRSLQCEWKFVTFYLHINVPILLSYPPILFFCQVT